MEKTQADAIARAILEPDLRAQEELRTKRALEAAHHARKRRIAWFTLAGCGIGAAVAFLSGERLLLGFLWGSIAGSAVGWLVARRAAV